MLNITSIPTSTFIPSPQQADFINFAESGSGSCVLEAVAGAGKTTTILQAVKKTAGSAIILAYNKKIAEELKEKLKRDGVDWKKAEAATVHSIGLRAFRKRFPGAGVNENKIANLWSGEEQAGNIPIALKLHVSAVCQLISLAKQNGFGVRGIIEIDDVEAYIEMIEHYDILDSGISPGVTFDIISTAIRLLKMSNDITDVIDFDDMVYMPLVHNVRFWQYDIVVMDEAQDTNTVRREIVKRLLKRGGRFFAVGDSRQAIYGFTGASSDALEIIKREFGAIQMPLTVTYRCPKAVVEFARRWVDHIEAHPSAPEGKLSASTFEDFITRQDLNRDAAVHCRNTKPLVKAAFALIRAKVPCRIEGRDIAEGLKKLALRWKSAKTLGQLSDRLKEYQEREVAKALEKKKETQAQQIEDKVDTLRVIMSRVQEDGRNDVDAVVAYIDQLFGDNVSSVLTLSTIHKSKGREWKRVFWLDRVNTCPSRYATQEWQKVQEHNLCYVAATRAMDELIELLPPTEKKAANENNKPTQEKAA
jgi:superfamily I DNA/RNA helicase